MNAVVRSEQSIKRLEEGKPLGGPPCKYTEDEILDKTEQYIVDYGKHGDKIPSIQGLAVALKVSRTTIYQWVEDGNVKLSYILKRLMDNQGRTLLNNGLDGTFNPTITKLVLSKHGYTDSPSNSGTSVNVTINRGSVQVETQGQTIDIETD